MKDLEKIESYKHLQNELTYFNQDNSPSHGFENVSILIVKKKTFKNRKKHNVFMQAQHPRIASRLSRSSKSEKHGSISRHSSMPELNKYTWPVTAGAQRNRNARENETKLRKYIKSPFQSKFIVKVVSEHGFVKKFNPFNYPRQTKLKIYRCQLGAVQDSCCCSCNSDAMFEVMKGLYDCYKAKNCDNCDCILCGHLKPEQRKPKSITGLSEKARLQQAKEEGLLTPLAGKTSDEREKILRGLSMKGLPLPEGKTPSEKTLIQKVRTDLGLPKEPKDKAERDKHEEAAKAGKLWPLEGKTLAEKEKILKGLKKMGITLPEGRTPSEKSLIAKIESRSRSSKAVSKTPAPSEQMRRAKAEGLLTPLAGKTPEQKANILKALAMKGLPLPEGKTPSEKQLINKVRADLGLPKEPKDKAERNKHEKAAKAGKLLPLEGKTPAQKENILKGLHNMGIPLPEGRTPSEKALIAKIAASSRHPSRVSKVSLAPSEQIRRAKAEGLLTPLTGKTPEQKETILKGLSMKGLPLPEGKTPSEKQLIDKVRTDLGLPKEPKSKSERDKHERAARAGLLQPLEGKTPAQKEKILKGLHDLGIPLPEGRTPSEKSLIAKIAASSRHPSKVTTVTMAPSEQMRRAKAEGLLTPLTGKTPEQKEKILNGLAMKGIPLPEGQTPSEKKLIDKVRADLGLPKEPKNKAEKAKLDQAARAGLLQPLEGKTPAQKEKILKGLHDLGIALPEGRTPSEKALIAKVAASSRRPSKVSKVKLTPSEQMRQAKAEGLLTPLTGKTPEQKEKILAGLAKIGLPLPEGKTPSDKKLIDKVRTDLGLPKEPKNRAERVKHNKAAKAGFLQPLEGKTPAEKEKILRGLHDLGISLPEGRTPSEKSLIAKVAASSRHPSKVSDVTMAPSEQMRRAVAAGLLTPLTGKTPEQKEKILEGLAMRGLPLPEGKTPSEKKLIDKVRADLGLPKEPKNKAERENQNRAAKAGLLQPLEGKTPAQKEKILKGLHDLGIPLPEGRTPSEKALIAKVAAKSRHPSKVSAVTMAPSEQVRSVKTEGLLTPLTGKTPEQKEKILQGLAKKGLALPEGKTPSEKQLIDKVRADLGLPKEPKSKAERNKHDQAVRAGLLQPLEGKTPAQKEKILQDLHDLGISLPEGRTPSEKSLIAKVAARSRHPSRVSAVTMAPSEQMRRAKAEGLLTPLTGKTPEQKEKILKALAMKGLPLPEGKTPSEKQLINKVRADLGLPKEPKDKAERNKHEKAAKAGRLFPLEGKTPAQKEKILQGLHDLGISLPEGRTPSEKSLIAKVAARSRHPSKVSDVTMAPSEQMRRAKAEGLLTPITGKTPEQKEKILKALAMKGLPLPEGKTPSEKQLINKVRADLGLPKEPKDKAERNKHEKAAKDGKLFPLEGRTPAQKEKILKGLHDMGISLPEGRTPSEKSLIAKIAASSRHPSKVSTLPMAPSEQMRRAKAEGLLTPLTGKTPEQKEKILKALAMKGLPLPEGKTPSEKQLINKVRADLGLPKEPKDKAERNKHEKAAKAGRLFPLEGRTPAQKEKILQGLHDLGISLPEGRTPSEKSLIAKVAARSRHPSKVSDVTMAPSEQMRRAKAEGLLTPLTGKTPEQKEKILKALAMKGLPLPEGKTPSEKQLINKVRTDLGLPKEPKNKAERNKHEKAAKDGKLFPLEGRTPAQKEKILKGLHDMGISLPEGRTPSEKSLIAKIAASSRHPSKVSTLPMAPSEQMRRAKAEGLLTPLTGKTPEQKEKILKALAMKGLPLPEGKTPSEKQLINKVRADLGLPKEPKDKAERNKHEKAAKAGRLFPLEGKTPAQKEKILQGLHDLGISLPEGRTPSEKSLIAKVAARSRHPSRVSDVTMAPSEQMRRAKAEGLLTPLTGKTPDQKANILKALAMKGLPLPEGKTPSEKQLINKVRADLGLPKEPKDKAERNKHEKAAKAGKLFPLEGRTPAQKEKILKGLHDMGISLPEGRTPSEKSLIAKIAASSRHPSKVSAVTMAPSEQMRRAKAEGLLTPLTGKTPEQKEKILKALAMKGLPLPEGKTPSEKQLINKVRADLGLPKEPKNKAERNKHEKAAKDGKLFPLEGRTPAQKEKILKGLHDMGISLPEGRTPSEKSLIAKIAASSRHPSKVSTLIMAPSEQMRRAKAEGLLTPLTGKTPEQKEKILQGLAKKGLALPEGKTPSEKQLIDKVREDLGLPKEPKNKAERAKHDQAAKAGLLQPLEGKTPAQKEKILQGLHDLGISLPEGRTPSEKSLIAKIAARSRHPSKVSAVTMAPSEQMRRAKAEGLLTPLTGKTPEQKEKILQGLAKKGLALPEGKTPSEKQLIDKVREDLGLPKEPKNKAERAKHDQAAKAGLLQPLEGKTPAQKEKILQGLHDLGISLPEGRTPSEKSLIAKIAARSRHPSKVSAVTMAPSEQMRRAKAEGLLTPLTGKTPEQKEKILQGLAKKGLALPEGKTPSEKRLIDKVREDLGLPKEPKNKAERAKHDQAAKAGLLQPLEGKTPAQKEKILQGLHDLGISLPEGRTPSEKSLIAKIAARSRHPSKVSAVTMAPSEQMRRAKAEGLLTPLTGKTPEQQEKMLKALANRGLPLPEGQSPSEKKIIDKVRLDLGLPKEPKTKADRDKLERAALAGLLLPLEGKTPAQKAKILRGQHNMGIPLPEGRTPSEKSLIAKIAASSRHPSKVPSVALAPSELMRRAKAEGLLTPLTGKTPEQKEKILEGLAKKGLALPEGKTPSEKQLIDKVRADLGLPKEPKNKAERAKHDLAAKAGLLQPLEGKTPAQKEKILKGLHDMGISLPEGRTPSEKSLIAKIAASSRRPSKVSTLPMAPSEQMRRAKAEGLLTPLTGKTPEQKEKILEGLAKKGLPLPEGKTPSEKKLIDKIRTDLGLPKEPKNEYERDKHDLAAKAGLLQPLEGKTPEQKEKILKGLHDLGITLPEGRTPSEKSLIAKVAASSRRPSKVTAVSLAPSEQMRRAKAEGLLTPLTGKTPEQKEKILKGLAMAGLPLPEGQTPSEKKLIDKVRADLGLPKEPKTKAERNKHEQAAKAGLLKPLEGKTPSQKKKILKGLHDLGIPLPEGRTPSEKSLIAKIAATSRPPSKITESLAMGLLTPLSGKKPEGKETIIMGLAMAGLPLPEGETPSEKKLIDKVRANIGLPPTPKNQSERDKHEKAAKAGLLKPLADKTPEEKEAILKAWHDLGIPLPEGRTPSEKSLIAKVAAPSLHPSTVAASVAKRKAVAAGIDEELEEIVKTTTCDRACGCTKKKIRFKHSYVKIRVTSPDISSFCDCPGECFPGVKSGAFIDNDGIKVTVGRVIGIPSFTISQTNHSYVQYGHKMLSVLKNNYSFKRSISVESSSSRPCSTESENIYLQDSTYECRTSKSDRIVECLRRLQSFDDIYRGVTSQTKSVASSHDPVLVIKSEISLCSSNTSKSVDTISSTSIMETSISSNCTRYSDNQSTDDPLSSSLLDGPITSDISIDHPESIGGRRTSRNIETVVPQREYTISRMSPTKFNFGNNNRRTNKSNSKTEEPIILFNRLPSKLDVSKIMYRIMASKRFAGASSIFIVVPASDDDEEHSFSDNLDSMTSMYESETSMIQKDSSHVNPNSTLRKSSFNKRNEQVCGKGKKFNLQEISSSNDTETMFQNESVNVLRYIDNTNDEICQVRKPNEIAQMLEETVHGIGTDTTADRPCCCRSKECSTPFVIQNCSSKDHYAANVMSKQKMPLVLQGNTYGCRRLTDTRTRSLDSLHLPCNVPTRPSIGSSQLPHKTFGYCRFPDMSSLSTLSSVMHCRPAPGGVEQCSPIPSLPLFTVIPSEMHDCSNLPVMLKASTKSLDHQCCIPKRCHGQVHVPLLDFEPQPDSPSTHHHLCKETCTPYGRIPDVSKKGTTGPRRSLYDSLTDPETNDARPSASTNKGSTRKIKKTFKTSPPRPADGPDVVSDPITNDIMRGLKLRPRLRASSRNRYSSRRQSKKLKQSSYEKHCVYDEGTDTITDELCNRKSTPRASRQSKMPKGSASEESCVCEGLEDAGIITDNTSCQQSKMPKGSASEESCVCEGLEDAGIRTDNTSCRQSKMHKGSASEESCVCEGLGDAGIITDNTSCRQSKMHKGSASKESCVCEGLEDAGIITDNTSCPQSKMHKGSSSEESRVCEDIEDVDQKCTHGKPKPFSFKKKIECQKKLKDSGNNGFCFQDLEESHRRYFTTKPGSKKSKITKFISSIRKSISHKTDESSKIKGEQDKCKCPEKKVKCKFLEESVTSDYFEEKTKSIIKLSEKKQNAEENPLKSKSQHSVQTTPEVSRCELNCGWMDIKKFIRLTSELAECTSGFKACKRKKEAEIELDFEAAVKYYVRKNLEQFRDLIQPLELDQDKYQGRKGGAKLKKKRKKQNKEKSNKRDKKNGSDNLKDSKKNVKTPLNETCEYPYGPTSIEEANKLTPEGCAELAKLYPKGMKLDLGGRGLAPVTKRVGGTAGRDGHTQTAHRTLDRVGVAQTAGLDGVVESSDRAGGVPQTAGRNRIVQKSGRTGTAVW